MTSKAATEAAARIVQLKNKAPKTQHQVGIRLLLLKAACSTQSCRLTRSPMCSFFTHLFGCGR